MMTYFLKSFVCLAILLAFYHLVLEREKMHQFNRFYLLGSVLFSFIAPLYSIHTVIPVEAFQTPITYGNEIIVNENTPLETPIDYWNIALVFSGLITFILTIRFGLNLFKIFRKVSKNTTIKQDKAVLVLVEDAISPHTFWNYIFINKDEYNSHKIEDELFTHELTHVTQKHTFDVLLIEVLKIVFWFNPLFYFLKKSIQLNHEFIADEKVINSFKNISEYQYLLLNKAAWNNDYYLASNLNYSLTKKRLVMMTTKTSKVNNWLKKIAVVPLLLGSIYVFAERVETYETKPETVLENNLERKLNNDIFIASVERDNNQVNLKCYNCERWANLSIPLNKDFTITDWGFTENKDVNNSEYAFTIKATEKEIILKGVKNMSWNSVTPLSNSKKLFFNQLGTLKQKENNLNTVIEQYAKLDAPTLFIDQKTNKYYLNNRLININNIKDEFLKETNGKKSDLEIFTTGKVLMSFIKSINEKLSKKHLNKILLTNSLSFLYDDNTSLSSSKIEYNFKNKRDSIPALKRIVNGKKRTFTYTTKNGKTITKKFADLTEEEKKLMPPPPAPIVLKEKTLSAKLFQELKNSKKYAIWIDGRIAKNEILNNYKNTDFYNYSGSFVHKNARSKRFPQEYQYNLNTKKHILKIKKQLPPPPPQPAKSKTLKEVKPVKIEVKETPKTGFINVKNQTLYYVKNKNGTTYYNRWAREVTKEGKIINPEQTASNKVIPGQNITKVYKDDKVVSEFKQSNLPPPPPPMSAEEMTYRYPKAKYYINGKKVSHKKALDFVKKNKEISVLTQEKNGKKIIKFAPIKSQVSIDKINDLSNSEIIRLPKGSTKNISYYLDDQPIAKEDLDKISPQKIATLIVKKEKDNSKSIYATSKK